MKSLLILILFYSTNLFAQSSAEVLRILNKNTNFYEVLNVSPDASPKEITTAIRKLRSIYHPDRNPTRFDSANAVMKRLNDASEMLTDDLKRKSYDITIKATSAMKNPVKNSSSAASSGPWKKHEFTDFSAKEKPTEKPQAKPKPETKAEPKAEAKAEPAKPEAPAKASTEVSAPVETKPSSYSAKRAQKMYTENARCGAAYFKNFFIDEKL